MSIWGRRARPEPAAPHADLGNKAGAALVATDERIRATADELGFATAELGEGATASLRVGLTAVQEHLGEAFQLHQLCHDDIPDTPDELLSRYARIIQLCEWAEAVLDERTEALKQQVAIARSAPQAIQRLRNEIERLQRKLPETRATLDRLSARYLDTAMQRVRISADEAEHLLDFALHSAEVSERRRAAGRGDEANLALETATESVRRATAMLDGVDRFEFEAMRTQTTLRAVIDDSHNDIRAARAAQVTPKVAAAITALEEALNAQGRGLQRDPFAELARISAANAALDAARSHAAKPVASVEHVNNEIATADRAIGIATTLIGGHRGWIGADARTRLAEAQRLRSEVEGMPDGEDFRNKKQQIARRIRGLAESAITHAQRDIDASRPDAQQPQQTAQPQHYAPQHGQQQYPPPQYQSQQQNSYQRHQEYQQQQQQQQQQGKKGGAGGLLGPVIGGVVLGAIIDNLFD